MADGNDVPETSSISKRHILLVSFPAFGHMIPILELAKKLSKYHTVTFAISAAKVSDLTSRELTQQGDTVQIAGIADGVFEDFDNPGDLNTLRVICDGVFPAVADLLRNVPTRGDAGCVLNYLFTIMIYNVSNIGDKIKLE